LLLAEAVSGVQEYTGALLERVFVWQVVIK
jgi:hypothetical protein